MPPTRQRDRIEEIERDIRARMGDRRHEDPLAAFVAAVPPSRSISRYADEVLQLAEAGYSTLQIVAFLNIARGIKVCDRTLRKFVNDEFKRALAGNESEDLDFAARARFALDRKRKRKTITRTPELVAEPAPSATVKTSVADADQVFEDALRASRAAEAQRNAPRPSLFRKPPGEEQQLGR